VGEQAKRQSEMATMAHIRISFDSMFYPSLNLTFWGSITFNLMAADFHYFRIIHTSYGNTFFNQSLSFNLATSQAVPVGRMSPSYAYKTVITH